MTAAAREGVGADLGHGTAGGAADDGAFALARTLATQATRGFGLTKRALNASFANSLDAQLDVEAQAMHEAGQTADYEEGVRAFLEKRKPVYRGA